MNYYLIATKKSQNFSGHSKHFLYENQPRTNGSCLKSDVHHWVCIGCADLWSTVLRVGGASVSLMGERQTMVRTLSITLPTTTVLLSATILTAASS